MLELASQTTVLADDDIRRVTRLASAVTIFVHVFAARATMAIPGCAAIGTAEGSPMVSMNPGICYLS